MFAPLSSYATDWFEMGVVLRKFRMDELSSTSIRPKQATGALSRFDSGINVTWPVPRHNQVVSRRSYSPLGVI
jgi:hypothetical protein